MQAIIELFDELVDGLKQLKYERIFVVSVVVLTLLGSLYVYLMDFLLADYLAQKPVAESEMAARLAPIGRVVLAEVAVTAPARDPLTQGEPEVSASPEAGGPEVGLSESADEASATLAAEAVSETLAPDDPASVALPGNGDGVVPGERPSAAESSQDAVISAPVAEPESASGSVETAASGVTSVDTTAGQPASAPAPIETAVPDVTSADTTAGQPASADGDVPAEPTAPTPDARAPVSGYAPAPTGYMPLPMPGQTYAPGYSPYGPQSGPQYPAPPLDPRQVPGATSWYSPYQPYSAPQYQRPGAPVPVYPAPPGWAR